VKETIKTQPCLTRYLQFSIYIFADIAVSLHGSGAFIVIGKYCEYFCVKLTDNRQELVRTDIDVVRRIVWHRYKRMPSKEDNIHNNYRSKVGTVGSSARAPVFDSW